MNGSLATNRTLCAVLLACLTSGSWAFAQSLEAARARREVRVAHPEVLPPHLAAGGQAADPVFAPPPSSRAAWGSRAWYQVESSTIAFGEVISGTTTDLPQALVIRVFSARAWSLRLLPSPYLEVPGRGESIPASRLRWRSGTSGSYLALQGAAPVEIASGPPTGGAGSVVVVDLQLRLEESDPLGLYTAQLRLMLETN